MCKVIKPPVWSNFATPSIFLAGSIEMNAAENWQEKVEKELSDFPIEIYNPRRDDWDSSWTQDISDPTFYEQVTWELDHLEGARLILLYLDPNTKSPISLLELGLFSSSERLVVCCPDGFWRKGNVQIVCERYDIPLFDTYDEWIEEVKNRVIKFRY